MYCCQILPILTYRLIIENKIDLPNAVQHNRFMPSFKHVQISLHAKKGLKQLREIWLSMIESSVQPTAVDGVVVNARHAGLLNQSKIALELAFKKMKTGELSELIAADLRDALESIGGVVGKVDNEQMLDRLFEKFCIGK